MWTQQSVSSDISAGEAADGKAYVLGVHERIELQKLGRCSTGGGGNLLIESSRKPEQATVFIMAITGQ